MWPVIDQQVLLALFVVLASYSAARRYLITRYHPERKGKLLSTQKLSILFSLGAAGVLLHQTHSLESILIVTFLVGGMSAGAVTVYAGSFGMGLLFILPATVPIAIFLFYTFVTGNSFGITFIFYLLMLVSSLKTSCRNVDSILSSIKKQREAAAALLELNKELARSQEEPRAANRMKSDFLASMFHELRSTLGFSIRLSKRLDESIAARDLDALQTVERNAKHLMTLINQVLELSQVEMNAANLRKSEFDFQGVVQEVTDSLEPIVKATGLDFIVSPVKCTASVVVDRDKLTVVLATFVANAIQRTGRGSVIIRL